MPANVSELFVAAVSITPTRRRRFLWAAWWTAQPATDAFRNPDASSGGARTREEALSQAERAAGRPLVEIDARWARAWARILLGQPPFPSQAKAAGTGSARAAASARGSQDNRSIWTILGVAPGATIEEIKTAFRRHALATHPDHGGEADDFRAVRHAYVEALRRRKTGARPR